MLLQSAMLLMERRKEHTSAVSLLQCQHIDEEVWWHQSSHANHREFDDEPLTSHVIRLLRTTVTYNLFRSTVEK